MTASAPGKRRLNAREAFKNAHDCIGRITPGHSVFAITRGQFSMIDAILACLDQCGPARVSLWTWTVAEYEVQCMDRLMRDGRVTDALLIIDGGARKRNAALLAQWRATFGQQSVRYVLNHAKIATIESAEFRILLRGSMNLNFNPRFEQFDLTEGGHDFTLVRAVELEIPVLQADCSGSDVYKASRVSEAFSAEQLNLFSGVKTWAK